MRVSIKLFIWLLVLVSISIQVSEVIYYCNRRPFLCSFSKYWYWSIKLITLGSQDEMQLPLFSFQNLILFIKISPNCKRSIKHQLVDLSNLYNCIEIFLQFVAFHEGCHRSLFGLFDYVGCYTTKSLFCWNSTWIFVSCQISSPFNDHFNIGHTKIIYV